MRVLVGENIYARDVALKKLTAEFDDEVVVRDGDELSLGDMPDLLMGQSLFSTRRMVVLKRLSENTELWQKFEEWHKRLSDDVDLIIVEDKPDRRTAAWKYLQKYAEIHEYALWTPKQKPEIISWIVEHAKHNGLVISKPEAQHLMERVGLDQYNLAHAIEKLVLAGRGDRGIIDQVTEVRPEETAFALLEYSLHGETERLQGVIADLKRTEDPYRVMALLASQLVQLAAIHAAGDAKDIAKEIGIPPFVVSRLKRLIRYYSPAHIQLAAKADYAMKTIRADPWELVEQLLLEIATTE